MQHLFKDKAELIQQLEAVVREEDLNKVIPQVNLLESEFEKIYGQKHDERLEQFKAEGNDPIMFDPPKDPEDGKFRELINLFSDRKKKFLEEKKQEEKNNLSAKKQVIEELKKLVEQEDHIGRSLQVFRDLREKWRTTGDVSVHKHKELQTQYRKLAEEFYYNIKIYKELKEHDLKRNYDLRNQLIEKIHLLPELDSVKDAQEKMRAYQEEWDELGPVTREKWEELRERFHSVTTDVYAKIKEYYQNIKEQRKKNLEIKTGFCEQVEVFNAAFPDSLKKWQAATNEVLSIQQEWKKTGFADKKKEKVLWERFRQACDTFFNQKSEFFKELKDHQEKNKLRKRQLIELAEAITFDPDDDFIDWKKLTGDIIALQKRRKETAAAAQKDEQHLWSKFRKICDRFFESKKIYFDSLDKKREQNLEKKHNLIQRLQDFQSTGEPNKDKAEIKTLCDEWNKIGFVPKGKTKSINEEYNRALDEVSKKTGMGQVEKEKVKFSSRMEVLKTSGSGIQVLQKEKKQLQEKIKQSESAILQYENNLGFFGNSKGTEVLKQEVEEKIQRAKDDLAGMKEKLKMVDMSLRKSN